MMNNVNNVGAHVIFGDFNVLRNSSKRLGSMFNQTLASNSNNFINKRRLWGCPTRWSCFYSYQYIWRHIKQTRYILGDIRDF